ncbi:MAG: sugar kinase [Cyanosarcina radialis HA8281-LM2]|jgi:sugar/nucleoside kinase (ribokinase family)|nr:sugar kinase [Cyanosarcina radialis HA8281-LM2]
MSLFKPFRGLFVGLITLDTIYLAESAPSNNQKIVALDYTVAAGGPATNAAVTFSYLSNQDRPSSVTKLVGAIGTHPISQLIRSDLANYQIQIVDLAAKNSEPPPISSIIVTRSTGDRAVVSLNAKNRQIEGQAIDSSILQDIDMVLIDGHQIAIGEAIASGAKAKNIPVVIDGGSWKHGFQKVLPFVDYAICSANFFPPNCNNAAEVFAYLSSIGIPHIAITEGKKPIKYLSGDRSGAIDVPQLQALDTLGAGDIFHGAFCYYILQADFPQALASAAKIASHACQFFGPRQWMEISNK